MSVAQSLPNVVPEFLQNCPYCGRANRMVVKGVYRHEGKAEVYPDIGYSFCNCKSIFYTNHDNIWFKADNKFQNLDDPLTELRWKFGFMKSGEALRLIMPDPFFCQWGQNPYDFLHWDPRRNHILWDMDSFCEEAEKLGFKVLKKERDFLIETETPQTMHLLLEKP